MLVFLPMNQDFRFSGIQRLYGVESQQKILNSHVLIVGLGGVGSWVAESLARSGIGQISFVDMDEVCESNMNRQIQALSNTIGKSKIDCLKERVQQINPNCKVNCIFDFLSAENVIEILSSKPHVVVDAIDSIKNKCEIASKCREMKIPLVCVGAAGGKIDPSKICIDDLSKTKNDSLLSQMRKQLRQKHSFPRGDKSFGIPSIYSSETAKLDLPENCSTTSSVRLDCASGFGSVSHVTGTFGLFAAHKAIDLLLSKN